MILIFCWTDDDLYKLNQRDPRIIEKIYSKYKTKVYNFLIIKTNGDVDTTEEIFSQTFHSAIESAPKIKNTENLLSWLMQIANRRLLDFLRGQYRKEKYLHKIHEEKEIDPFVDATEKEEILMFNIIFDKLPENNKKVLTLKYIDEKSQKEIAKIFGKSEKAIESLLSRSKQLLKKELKKHKRFFND